MIKNIILDVGKVLVAFSHVKILKKEQENYLKK